MAVAETTAAATGGGPAGIGIGAALTAIGGLLGLFGGGSSESGFEPHDIYRRLLSSADLGPEGLDEKELADLQQAVAKSLMGATQGPLPGGLSLSALTRGEIPDASRARIREQAFGGLNEALKRAQTAAMSRYGGMGMPMSSQMMVHTAELQRPLMMQAAQMQASLEQNELQRLMGLRQKAIANRIAAQQSPALDRLLKIRMAEAKQKQENLTMARYPGGLPDYAYGPGGSGVTPRGGQTSYPSYGVWGPDDPNNPNSSYYDPYSGNLGLGPEPVVEMPRVRR